MLMPPTFKQLKSIETSILKKYTEIKNAHYNPTRESSELNGYIDFLLDPRIISPQHIRNLYNAIDKRHDSHELTRDGSSMKYFPVDILLRRALDAIVLDREIVRQAWVEAREQAIAEISEFEAGVAVKIEGAAKRVKLEK